MPRLAWAAKPLVGLARQSPVEAAVLLRTQTASLLGAITDGHHFPAAAVPAASETESPCPALLTAVSDRVLFWGVGERRIIGG